MTALDSCAGDENRDLMPVCEDGRDELRNGGLVGEVGGVDGGFAAEVLDGFLCGCGFEVALIECQFIVSESNERLRTYLDEDDVCAGFGEANGDGCADASGATGDEGGLALEGEESRHCHSFESVLCDLNSNCRFVDYVVMYGLVTVG